MSWTAAVLEQERFVESRKTGRSGYAPACTNEWVRGVCGKPRTKCTACPHRKLIPVSDGVVHAHLTGQDGKRRPFVMGVYPMLMDETCRFLAIDLDNANWQDDACALQETCVQLELPAALERSRSANGGHLWLFFLEALPAVLARNLGGALLTATMARRPELGFASGATGERTGDSKSMATSSSASSPKTWGRA